MLVHACAAHGIEQVAGIRRCAHRRARRRGRPGAPARACARRASAASDESMSCTVSGTPRAAAACTIASDPARRQSAAARSRGRTGRASSGRRRARHAARASPAARSARSSPARRAAAACRRHADRRVLVSVAELRAERAELAADVALQHGAEFAARALALGRVFEPAGDHCAKASLF